MPLPKCIVGEYFTLPIVELPLTPCRMMGRAPIALRCRSVHRLMAAPRSPQAVYRSSCVEFLLDEEDSVAAYEACGRRRAGSYAAGMQALESMDRVQQLEVVHGEHHRRRAARGSSRGTEMGLSSSAGV